MLAQAFIAAALAFQAPASHLGAPLGAVRAPVATPNVYMAGWNDPFMGKAPEQKREKLGDTDIGKNLAFDEKMKQDQEGMVKMMYGGSAVMIGGILAILLPLLASQPDA